MRKLLPLLTVLACHDPDIEKVIRVDSDVQSSAVSDQDVGSPPVTPVEADPVPPNLDSARILVVVDSLIFPRVADDGKTAFGLNLDDKVSDDTDPLTCGKPDLITPEGDVGIDNQLATLIPLFEFVGLGAFETLVQRAIDEGGLLILFQLDGVDDLENDPDVQLTMRLGEGVPLLGTNGRLLAGQTYQLHPESPEQLNNARIENGVLIAGGFDNRIPIVVFGQLYELTMKGAEIRAPFNDDGGINGGLLSGRIPMADLIAIATKANNNDDSILASVQTVLGGAADFGFQDGECTQISAAIQFEAVSAFLYQDYYDN